IRPISNTTEIFDTGLEAASFSFLASNLGLKSNTGSLNANEGTSFCSLLFSSFFSSSLLTASHILVAFGVSMSLGVTKPVSGNFGSSCSTTMCFFSRNHPLGFDFMPFDFCMTLRRDAAAAGESLVPFLSDLSGEHGSVLSFVFLSVNSTGEVGSAGSDFELSCLICVIGVFVTRWVSNVGVSLLTSAFGPAPFTSDVGVFLPGSTSNKGGCIVVVVTFPPLVSDAVSTSCFVSANVLL
uniref:Uncharacterized protein n=1 Tax=Poecilia latipinna TaxID=48699 RepID=A0A3B3V3E7_9TELE